MVAIFDGHNDTITRDDYALIATGRAGGHLDLPRMRAGGMRGGIFAVFTSSAGHDFTAVQQPDGAMAIEPAAPVPHVEAAEFAARAAGRLLALDQCLQEPAEVREVVVDDGPRDAGGAGDRLDRYSLVPLFDDHA